MQNRRITRSQTKQLSEKSNLQNNNFGLSTSSRRHENQISEESEDDSTVLYNHGKRPKICNKQSVKFVLNHKTSNRVKRVSFLK